MGDRSHVFELVFERRSVIGRISSRKGIELFERFRYDSFGFRFYVLALQRSDC